MDKKKIAMSFKISDLDREKQLSLLHSLLGSVEEEVTSSDDITLLDLTLVLLDLQLGTMLVSCEDTDKELDMGNDLFRAVDLRITEEMKEKDITSASVIMAAAMILGKCTTLVKRLDRESREVDSIIEEVSRGEESSG